MIQLFSGKTADEVWLKIALPFQNNEIRPQDSRAGATFEILHAAISVADPLQRWVISRVPAMSPAFAIAEVIWILTGSNDLRFLQYWAPQFGRFSDNGETLHGAYGHRLRHHFFGRDQLKDAYETLSHNRVSRQVVLQIWNTTVDLPVDQGEPRSKDVPCNVVSLLKVRDGRLEWTQVIRSNDVFLGTPHNFVQFMSLQEIMAGWLGIDIGSYNQFSDSLHVYKKDLHKIISSQPVTAEHNTDSLSVPWDESQWLFSELRRRGDDLIASDLKVDDVHHIARWDEAPVAYRNLLRVLVAESCLVRNWDDDARSVAAEITNPIISQLWDRWMVRKEI